MKKIFIPLLSVIALFSTTSCEDTIEETQVASVEAQKAVSEFQQLVQQVRAGDTNAYEALAKCYKEGIGTEQSTFNMFTMYMLSCTRTGKDINTVIDKLEENHPIRLLTEILDHPNVDKIPQDAVDKLRQVSPADAMIYDAICAIEYQNDTITASRLLDEAETNGNEMACLVQILLYDKIGDEESYERKLIEYSGKHPLFFVVLGDYYMERAYLERQVYGLNHDAMALYTKAMDSYLSADRHGMLTMRGAVTLHGLYDLHEKHGNMSFDAQEKTRVYNLSQKIVYN